MLWSSYNNEVGISADSIPSGSSMYTGLLYRIAEDNTLSISFIAVLGSSDITESTVTFSKTLSRGSNSLALCRSGFFLRSLIAGTPDTTTREIFQQRCKIRR